MAAASMPGGKIVQRARQLVVAGSGFSFRGNAGSGFMFGRCGLSQHLALEHNVAHHSPGRQKQPDNRDE